MLELKCAFSSMASFVEKLRNLKAEKGIADNAGKDPLHERQLFEK